MIGYIWFSHIIVQVCSLHFWKMNQQWLAFVQSLYSSLHFWKMNQQWLAFVPSLYSSRHFWKMNQQWLAFVPSLHSSLHFWKMNRQWFAFVPSPLIKHFHGNQHLPLAVIKKCLPLKRVYKLQRKPHVMNIIRCALEDGATNKVSYCFLFLSGVAFFSSRKTGPRVILK